MNGRAALLAVLAALACSKPAQPNPAAGHVVAVIQPLSAGQVTRVAVSVSPAAISQDLAYNPADGTFAGVLTVPVGTQALTATAYVGDAAYGTGTATADVTENGTAMAYISILDTSARKPAPDHGPVVTSVVVSDVTPVNGKEIRLAASAIDPDGDPISFAWGDECGGTFANTASAVTTWASPTVGPCRLTVTATSRQLSDARVVQIQARPPTGQISVTGLVVPQPTIDVVTVADGGGQTCTMQRGGPGADGTCHLPVPGGAQLAVTLAASDAIPGATLALTDDCGGTAQPGPGATFAWTAPVAGGLCIVTAAVSQAGLSDLFPVAIFVEPSVLAGRVVTRWIGGTIQVVPSDLSSGIVEAFDSSGMRYVGRGDPAGNFWFDALPDGVVTIHVEGAGGPPRYHVTARRGYLDLESTRPGRPDTLTPNAPTPMTIGAVGLDPWVSQDRLQYFDTNGSMIESGSPSLVFDPFWGTDGLLDTSRGDIALIAQQEPAVAVDGTPYRYAARIGQVDPVTVQDGLASTITATLLPVATVPWTPPPLDPDLFGQIDDVPFANPGPSRSILNVQALPPGAGGLYTPGGAFLSLLSADLSAFSVAPALGGLRYGELPGWTPFLRATHSRCCATNSTIPGGGTMGFGVTASFSDLLGGGPMQMMGFARDITIDGRSALQTLTGVSPTPTVAWTAPATGPVGSYRVLVYQITTYAGRIRTRALPTISTDETSVQLPPGFLEPGCTYYASVMASSSAPASPTVTRFPYATSTVPSGAFTVQ
jgi:hypothetical protein